jgi:hypothetical protein
MQQSAQLQFPFSPAGVVFAIGGESFGALQKA